VSDALLRDAASAAAHDLRSSASSLSLAVGLLADHPDDEVRAIAGTLRRAVSSQQAVLTMLGALAGDAMDERLPLGALVSSTGGALETSFDAGDAKGIELAPLPRDAFALALARAAGGARKLEVEVSDDAVVLHLSGGPPGVTRAKRNLALLLLDARASEPVELESDGLRVRLARA